MRQLAFSVGVLIIVVEAGVYSQCAAQADAAANAKDDGMVALTFPENMELKLFVELVSKQVNVNILFDEVLANKRITIKSPAEIPRRSLMGLLESTLKMKGLAIVEDDQPGWKRIVAAQSLVQIAKPKGPDGAKEEGPATAVTQIFTLKHTDTKRVSQVLRPFMTQPGANVLELEEHGLLIVTEYASNMGRLAELVKLTDQPTAKVTVNFLTVKNLEASALAQQINQLLISKTKAENAVKTSGAGAAGGGSASGPEVTHIARTNQLVVIGTEERIAEALQVAQKLDVPMETETRTYQFAGGNADRVDRLTKELIGPLRAGLFYRSALDREAGLLIVTAPADIHLTVVSLKKDLDQGVTTEQSPIRFYKLANATAADVLETIRLIEGSEGVSGAFIEGAGAEPGQRRGESTGPRVAPGLDLPRSGAPTTGPNQPPGVAGAVAPKPPAYQASDPKDSSRDGQRGGVPDRTAPAHQPARSVRTRQATVTADPNTNSLIVVADAQAQRLYEQLIHSLDRRRPQVLIEATIVTVDTTNGFSLGVEIARNNKTKKADIVTFSSFGLSDIAELGRLALIPGAGFNGTVISSDIADIVIRALASDTRAKVMSAPRVLVNDNAVGTLSSIAEEPFVSVNASDTVATTSFAGFVSAGTDVTVRPQISEGDHLKLQFSIALNNFSGAGSAGIPPPRQTNSISSEVTIPDGHTIIVGGLNRKNYSKTKSAVPILGDLPVLEHLFSNQAESESNSTLFVFLRPIILRDDQFQDLRYYSRRDTAAAGLPQEHPASAPLVVR